MQGCPDAAAACRHLESDAAAERIDDSETSRQKRDAARPDPERYDQARWASRAAWALFEGRRIPIVDVVLFMLSMVFWSCS